METLRTLVDLVSPKESTLPKGAAERLFTAGVGLAAALGSASVWGLAAGTGGGHVNLRNLAVAPVLLVASTAASLPVGLLVFRLLARAGRVTDLVLAYASSVFTGGLVLLLLSPIVALYQMSSRWAGPWVVLASLLVAFAAGFAILVRALGKLTGAAGRGPFALPAALLVVLQIAALAQLASLAPPLMQERTRFGQGVDGASHAARVEPAEVSR